MTTPPRSDFWTGEGRCTAIDALPHADSLRPAGPARRRRGDRGRRRDRARDWAWGLEHHKPTPHRRGHDAPRPPGSSSFDGTRRRAGERATVESTVTTQSRPPSASAWASGAVTTFSQVPSAAHFCFGECEMRRRDTHGTPWSEQALLAVYWALSRVRVARLSRAGLAGGGDDRRARGDGAVGGRPRRTRGRPSPAARSPSGRRSPGPPTPRARSAPPARGPSAAASGWRRPSGW